MKKVYFHLILFILFTYNASYANDPIASSKQQDTTNNSTSLKLKYVGAKECGICHSTVYENWQKQQHSNAYKRLNESEQKNPNCLKCHTTGYGKEKLYQEVSLEGVQCEACHGPGSAYRPMDIMKDIKKSNSLGLLYPVNPQKVCTKCHLHRKDRVSPLCPGRD